MFEVWCVPPQNMIRSGGNSGVYALGNWRAERPPMEERTSSTPLPAVILNYYHCRDGRR